MNSDTVAFCQLLMVSFAKCKPITAQTYYQIIVVITNNKIGAGFLQMKLQEH